VGFGRAGRTLSIGIGEAFYEFGIFLGPDGRVFESLSESDFAILLKINGAGNGDRTRS
jgi:hypothetical protein